MPDAADLRGLDGHRRMGKSLGNYVGVGEPAKEQFAKIMSIPDELMKEWFELLTDFTADEIAVFLDPAKTKPFDAKKALGRAIVTFYHGVEQATFAQNEWEAQFSRKQDPNEITEVSISSAIPGDVKVGILKVLVAAGLAKSNNVARQKVTEGAVNIGPDRTKITDPKTKIDVTDGLVIRLGKKIVRVRRTD